MQAVWEANTSDFRKRRRIVRACSACQKRKRKCCHTFARDNIQAARALQEQQRPGTAIDDAEASQHNHVDSVRFVGDLNPESVLADLGERPESRTRRSRVGVWIGLSNEPEDALSNLEAEDWSPRASSLKRPGNSEVPCQNPHLLRFLHDTGAFTVLPIETQKSLIKLYVSHVHPFLPLIDVDSFLSSFEKGNASNFLVLAICLTASKSSEAAPFLHWEAEGQTVPARMFAKRLYDGLKFAINTAQEVDPLTRIQILGLLALHTDGAQGFENASMHLCQAIHHAVTLGLHVDSARINPRYDYTGRMFWSLWCLDRLSACMAGRPVNILDEDIGISRPAHSHDPIQAPFQQNLALCDLLSSIIRYYRPTMDQASTGWEEGFPTLEEITGRRNGSSSLELDVIIKLLYNIAAILACRAGTVGTRSYIRREAAANQIEMILRSEAPVHVSPLPIASYAASLSMTVAYRKLRDNQSASTLLCHVQCLASRCEILEAFRERRWSAEAMARLGRKALRNIQDISATQHNSHEMLGVAASQSHDGDVVNPLEMLSSVAESHAHGGLSEEVSQTPTSAIVPGKLPTIDDPAMKYKDGTESGATAESSMEFNSFRDLDNAFGDFFDLSTPTTFFDPLFEDIGAFDFSDLAE